MFWVSFPLAWPQSAGIRYGLRHETGKNERWDCQNSHLTFCVLENLSFCLPFPLPLRTCYVSLQLNRNNFKDWFCGNVILVCHRIILMRIFLKMSLGNFWGFFVVVVIDNEHAFEINTCVGCVGGSCPWLKLNICFTFIVEQWYSFIEGKSGILDSGTWLS